MKEHCEQNISPAALQRCLGDSHPSRNVPQEVYWISFL